MIRKLIAYKIHFVKFYKSQDSKTQEKIEYVLAESLKAEYMEEKYGGK